MDREEKNILQSWAREIKIEMSAAQIDLLSLYLDELCAWNTRMNLTGMTSRKTIIKELLLDSIFPALFLPEKGSLLDIGSGAGFPAIPIKICCPDLKVLLIESNSKKVSFLKQVIRLTRLPEIEVIQRRIEEDGGMLHSGGYNIITARALAPLPKTLALCAPNLAPGGRIISFQGSGFKNAIKESADICKKHRLFLSKSIPYKLPEKRSSRYLLVFKTSIERISTIKC